MPADGKYYGWEQLFMDANRETKNRRKGATTMADLFSEIRNTDIDTVEVDREIFLLAIAKVAQSEYVNFNAEPPEWLPLRVKQFERDIRSKRQAIIEKRIRDLENRKAALLPRDKKIENIDSELDMLKKQVQ